MRFGVFDFYFCGWERENEVERDLMVIDDAEQKKRVLFPFAE